jgi:hypothetical protein
MYRNAAEDRPKDILDALQNVHKAMLGNPWDVLREIRDKINPRPQINPLGKSE